MPWFASVYTTALITFYAEHRSSTLSSKALIVLTFAQNVTQSIFIQTLLKSAGSQGILMSVVAMGNVTTKSGLVSLVEDEQNVFTGGTTDITDNDVPWIVDLICPGTIILCWFSILIKTYCLKGRFFL